MSIAPNDPAASSQTTSAQTDTPLTLAVPITARMFKVEDAMTLLSLSRSVIFEELRTGRLRSVTVGRARRIPGTAIGEYIALLEREAVA